MAKYYVQSGTLKMIVQADDARRAALWVVHRAMTQVIPLDEQEQLSPQEKARQGMIDGWSVLGEEIVLSELGFNRADAWKMDTFDVVIEWNQLMIALAKIEEKLMASQSHTS